MSEKTTALQRLRLARDLIAKDGGWTQGTGARDSEGNARATDNPSAVCFCPWGAICKLSIRAKELKLSILDDEGERAEIALASVILGRLWSKGDTPPVHMIADWNDKPERKKSEAVAIFEKAITYEELRSARELIAKPGAWIQGEAAKASDGTSTHSREDDASCFCPWGAIFRFNTDLDELIGGNDPATVAFANAIRGPDSFTDAVSFVAGWNDTPGRTQSEVVEAFDKAIVSHLASK